MTKKIQYIVMTALLLMTVGVGKAWGADYKLTNGTYYVAFVNGDAKRVSEFNSSTCVWHCVDALENGKSATFTTANTSSNPVYLYQEYNGVKYFLNTGNNIHASTSNAYSSEASYHVYMNSDGYVQCGWGASIDLTTDWGGCIAHGTANTHAILNGYTVTFDSDIEKGTVTANKTVADAGSIIELTINPDSGYKLDYLDVTGEDGSAVSVTNYTFTMPECNVIVSANFIPTTQALSPHVTVTPAGAVANVTIATPVDGSQIYYTTNGEEPASTSTQYAGSFSINDGQTVKAIAIKDGLTNSNVVSQTYTAVKYTITANAIQSLFEGQQEINNNPITVASNEVINSSIGKKICIRYSSTNQYDFYLGLQNVGIQFQKADNGYVETEITSNFVTKLGSNNLVLEGRWCEVTSIYIADVGTVSVTGESYSGSTPTLTATPNTGYAFLKWSDGETANPRTITVTGDATYTAYFKLLKFYGVTVTEGITNGSVTADKVSAPDGDVVTLTISPAQGYELESLTVKDASNNTVAVTDNTFTMPASNVTISATFSKIQCSVVDDNASQNDRGYSSSSIVKHTFKVVNESGKTYTYKWKQGETVLSETETCELPISYKGEVVNVEVYEGGELLTTIATSYPAARFKGEGTETSPYKISNADELEMMSYIINHAPYTGYTTDYSQAYYELTDDITLTTSDFTPIGAVTDNYKAENCFRGHFEGKGHTISGLKETWYAGDVNTNDYNRVWGLFGVVQGTNSNPAVIQNLIISGATLTHQTTNTSFYYNNGSESTNGNNCYVGILAGIAGEYSTIQNIEVKGSSITDKGSNEYKLANKNLSIGGIVGRVQYDYSTKSGDLSSTTIKLTQLSSNCNITISKAAFTTSGAAYEKTLAVAGIIGSMESSTGGLSIPWPSYTYYNGTISTIGKGFVSPVFGTVTYNGNTGETYADYCAHYTGKTTGYPNDLSSANIYFGTGYTVNSTAITDLVPGYTCGHGARTIAAHTDDSYETPAANAFQGINWGRYVLETDRATIATTFNDGLGVDRLFEWSFNAGDAVMHLIRAKTAILEDNDVDTDATTHTLTAEVYGFEGTTTIQWYKNGSLVSGETGTTYSVTKGAKAQYVYFTVTCGDETKTSNEITIPGTTTFTASISKDDATGKILSVALTPSDLSGYTVTYQWKNSSGTVITDATTATYTVTTDDVYSCEITIADASLSSEYQAKYNQKLTVSIVSGMNAVYLDFTNGSDENDGKTIDKPKKTWKGAYGLLKYGPNAKRLLAQWTTNNLSYNNTTLASYLDGVEDFSGSVDNNIIYLVGDVSKDNFNELMLKANTYGSNKDNLVTYEHCEYNVLSNGYMKPATISGKYAAVTGDNAHSGYSVITIEDDHYNGTTGMYTLNEDTRFEDINFYSTNDLNNGGHGYLQIMCAYYNLEMGDGIQMSNMLSAAESTTDTGCVPNGSVPFFQIFGGYYDDGRFVRMSGGVSNFDKYLPHPDGFNIKIKSGYYATICAGSKQYDVDRLNGIAGTPNTPIKCTIDIDINRTFNDNHNTSIATSSITSTSAADYDIGAILAGDHEGAMYGDVDIIIRSGRVGRVVNGTLGSQREISYKEKNASGTEYSDNTIFPYDSYFGRADILVDPASSENNSATDINSRVLITELYGGGLGRVLEDRDNLPCETYFYGKSTVTVNGGKFQISDIAIKDALKLKTEIATGIFASGAGGVNGIGDYNSTIHTSDTRLPYWDTDKKRVVYGDYSTYISKETTDQKVKIHCLNEDDSYTDIDPMETSTCITINGGEFGSSATNGKIDGIYGGGYGYANTRLIPYTNNKRTPNVQAGSIFGKKGITVTTININGGTIYGDIYGASRGTSDYYSTKNVGFNTGSKYNNLALVTGNVILNIGDSAKIYGSVYGAGKGCAYTYTDNANPLHDMARLYGNSTVNISGNALITGDIYGGGENGSVTGDVAINVSGNAKVGSTDAGGNIYGGGLGQLVGSDTNHTDYASSADIDGSTHVEVEDLQYANTATHYIYGGGNYASKVSGNTNVTVASVLSYKAQTNVFGGGFGSATSSQNAYVTIKPFKQPDEDTNTYGFNDVYGGGNEGSVKGMSIVTIKGGTVLGNVYGGGHLTTATVGTERATEQTLENWIQNNGTSVTLYSKQANVYGDIFGGGNLAAVNGNTYVQLSQGNFGGSIYGGGNGGYDTDYIYANVTGNTAVYVAKDDGYQDAVSKQDNFSINVIWNKKWDASNDASNEKYLTWDSNKDSFYKDGKYLNSHNIYGGGNLACKVGTWTGDPEILTTGTGTAKVEVYKGMTPYELLKTTEWKDAYDDNDNPHFYVFGGGKGANTTVGNTDVTVNVDGEYGDYTADVDDPTEQLAKGANGLNDLNVSNSSNGSSKSPRKTGGASDSTAPVFDNSYGIPNFTVLGVLGGGYAGHVTNDTHVTIDGKTFLHRVYGGGFGDPESTENNTTGNVGGNTYVTMEGGNTYGDVFGGGAGVASKSNDLTDVARVSGKTWVSVLEDTKVFGNVYGGGDIANVGTSNATKDSISSVSTLTGDNTWTYKHANTQSYVHISGGSIYGEVFGGGRGKLKSDVNDYTKLGRIEGNALVHICDSVDADDNTKTIHPYVWNRIFGGCAYGTVNGNTMVHIEGGMIGHNIFGGGDGDASTDAPDSQTAGTYANVEGNTKVKIDGGTAIWNQYADTKGNIFAWNKATTKVVSSLEAAILMGNAAVKKMLKEYVDSTFFNYSDSKHEIFRFTISHNIYGGGRYACNVNDSANVILNHSLVNDSRLVDPTTVAGLCWYSVADNTKSPQFSVFGGGYGANTTVAKTNVYVQTGNYYTSRTESTAADISYLKPYRSQVADYNTFNSVETKIQTNWNALSDYEKTKKYTNYYRNYRTSQYAMNLGVPGHTFLEVLGGGYSGRVTGNTNVVLNQSTGVRNLFGGGLGAVADNASGASVPKNHEFDGTETYGQVGGNATVTMNSGIISENMYGGGGGVESCYVNGAKVSLDNEGTGYKLTDFPNMALVQGKTSVTIDGGVIADSYYPKDKTYVYGNVYGGGDVANVGTTTTQSAAATPTSGTYADGTTYQSTVTINGGALMGQVFAGGNGRLASKCTTGGYKNLGSIYGNTQVVVNTDVTETNAPWLWGRVYGGCQDGTVYGNTDVQIKGGHLGHNIYGGGWGSVDTLSVSGIATQYVTSADVTGNTNVNVSDGLAAMHEMWDADTRSWIPLTILGGITYSPQYNPETQKFKINHNIYGGGNIASAVEGDSYVTMTKGLLAHQDLTTSAISDDINPFTSNEWKEIFEKVGSPHFCVFGAGYGENTSVQNTHLDIALDTSTQDISDIEKGKEYMHFLPAQSVMDIVGGGYNGIVKENTNVNVSAGTFARRVFGGGFYNSVKKSYVNISAIDCQDIFGGGIMGDVLQDTHVNIGSDASDNTNSDIWIHNNIYGANDVSGYVNLVDKNAGGGDIEFKDNGGSGTNITIRGGHIFGNVYGAGNGDYLYALGKNGETKVTVNEDYQLSGSSDTYDLVYTVPMRSTMASAKSASNAQTIVNINSWRPLTNKVNIDIAGNSATDKVVIDGKVFGGGNSATVLQVNNGSGTMVGDVNFNIGNNINIGGVYLGSDGDQLFLNSAENAFLQNFQVINDFLMADSVDWTSDPANHGISEAYLPTPADDRPKVYPHLLDLYFQPVEMSIQPKVTWADALSTSLANATIGTFCCGGNRGNMNVEPDADGKTPVVDITFPTGLTITDKIIGGCNKANYTYNNVTTGSEVKHVGGYLLGTTGNPMIKLTVQNKFAPTISDDHYVGGNVYGGCYETGNVAGDIAIDYRSNSLNGLDSVKVVASNTAGIAACNVYGAGYGAESYVYGNIRLDFGSNKTLSGSSSKADMFSNKMNAPRKSGATFSQTGTSANFVFGGGQMGNVIGNTTVRILNGRINKSVTGGSYAGFQWGSTQVLVGYPSYYVCKKSGKYNIVRTDKAEDNLALHNTDENGDAGTAIKQTICLMDSDIVSSQVYDAIKNYTGTAATGTTAYASDNFQLVSTLPSQYGLTWDNINIQIGEAVYGGGYSLATGSSVLANNTTVLKYTNDYNIDDVTENLASLTGGAENATTVGFGGNTTMLIADLPTDASKEHITISSQKMKSVTLPDKYDLCGYYYKDKLGNYRYVYKAGSYFYNTDKLPTEINTSDHNIYEYDGEGGVFGDGHLSYAQGFRNGEVTGYGYAKHTVSEPKILNTFQRMDMLRLTDNCFSLLGARDYTVNEISTTPYSICRVGEVQMLSSISNDAKLSSSTVVRSRNYLGLSNNIHYVGAIYSNVDFGNIWHNAKGVLSTDTTYQSSKQNYIDDYYSTTGTRKGNNYYFQQRNDGTAKNMIGVASGYALKVQNVQEVYNSADKKTEEKIYYGPIYGVVEINLIDVREDEGGGYVYADNIHKRSGSSGAKGIHKAGESSTTEDFLETTGNFVFPYNAEDGRYIVDDCFTDGYDIASKSGTVNPETDEYASAHYWYVTGYNYYYTAHITGYTYDTSTSPAHFDLDNNDGLMKLTGALAGQTPQIYSIAWHSGHSSAENGYTCALETKSLNSVESGDLYDGGITYNNYNLGISAAQNGVYAESDAAYYHLPFYNNTQSEDAKAASTPILMTGSIPTALKSDANIGIRLTDNVDNSGTEYYNSHLKEPCQATIILTLPAYKNKYDPDNATANRQSGYIGVYYFYKRKVDGSGNVSYTKTTYPITIPAKGAATDTTYYYYNSVLNKYTEITDLTQMYTKSGSEYIQLASGDKMDVSESSSKLYYYKTEREYTYTIYLTIDYVQGPDVTGNITINNCALPGELVKLTTENVKIQADESMAPNGYYWRIGKKNSDGTDFEDTVNNWDHNTTNAGYDTYKVGSNTKSGVFTGCVYNQTENALYVPAYYFMNGYAVQYGFTVAANQSNQFFPVKMRTKTVGTGDDAKEVIADTLLIHNYHRMDPHVKDVNLHLAEALARAKAEPAKFAEPRIYLSDNQDLAYFVNFLDTIGTAGKTDGTVEKVKIGTQSLEVPRYGANAQFVVQNDLSIPTGYDPANYGNPIFAGTLHGEGHVIKNLGADMCLATTNNGQIYNLGLASGKIASSNTAIDANHTAGAYHCCYEYAPSSASDVKPIVYRMDGTAVNTYSYDDFHYGKVAYDLNQYYLTARQLLAGSVDAAPSSLKSKAESSDASIKAAMKYIHDYWANGDYQYARRQDSDTGETTGVTYLRTGTIETPAYGTSATRHDTNHTIDKPRAQGYVAATETTPESRTGDYLPLFNAAQQTSTLNLTEKMNDYIYWGQSLQVTPDAYPSTIASLQNSAMNNRVWRAVGYYGTTTPAAYHYNAFIKNSQTMATYVHNPSTTAVDFTCNADGAISAASYTIPTGGTGAYYAPYNDVATTYSSFATNDDVTRNLLIYTAAGTSADNEAYDVVHANDGVNYNETTVESNIRGHHITMTTPSTKYLHLVERATTADPNNDFCCPIAFNVTDRAWYTRQPAKYAENNNDAWEGICLPFTANKVAASLNGEITHFYGTATDTESADPSTNGHTLHHEYWLRGLTAVKTADASGKVGDVTLGSTYANKTVGAFSRPGSGLFDPKDDSDNSLSESVSYTFTNDFFTSTYGSNNYNVDADQNKWYTSSHTYDGYFQLTASIPYIVSFPGNRYYEFDLSSKFYNTMLGKSEDVQTVTFNAFAKDYVGSETANNKATGSIAIPVTTAMQTLADSYYHNGTFLAMTDATYGMSSDGTTFSNAVNSVLPFRTYMTTASSPAKGVVSRSGNTDVIYIGSTTGIESIEGTNPNQATDENGNVITIYPVDKGRVCVESNFDTTLKVYSTAGQLYRLLDVRQGTATYSGFQPGIYIAGGRKIRVQ